MKKIDPHIPQPLEEVVPIAIFKAEVEAWARRIGVAPKEIRLRPMKRKWASCSSHGRLTFDTALLRQPARFRAEVIAHELLHLKVPNHGKLFRVLLDSFLAQAWEDFSRISWNGQTTSNMVSS
jgi:hypothetical protein